MKVPAPLYVDPIYDGPADAMVIRKESDGKFYMFYTQRRANQDTVGVSFAYGCAIGVAESDNGAEWHYRGTLDLDFEFGHNTFWAPEIIYNPDEKLYHMYVSYIVGVYSDWGGNASIEHYTSPDLFCWTHIGSLSFGSERIIDPCCFRLPDGKWRMWYKDERNEAGTSYADSDDLYNWEYRGLATRGIAQEGANVFFFEGKYWLIACLNHGQAVYSSDDGEHFTRQSSNILVEPGTRRDDNNVGMHADVSVVGDRAFIVYFTHPDNNRPARSVVQMAELKVVDGVLTSDRNAELDIDWRV